MHITFENTKEDFSVFSNCVLCHSDLVRRLIQACETRSINWTEKKLPFHGQRRERCDVRAIPHFFSAAVRSWIARQILKSSRSSCRAEVYTGWLIGKLNVAPWIGHLLVGVVNAGVNLIKFAINLA